ncbi:hypothetical protein B296_00008340, partial [Ensete ventricosum]
CSNPSCPICVVAIVAAAPAQAAAALARRQPPCKEATTPATDTTIPAGNRAGRGWQSHVGALQSAPFAGITLQAGVPARAAPMGYCPCERRRLPILAGPGRSLAVGGRPCIGLVVAGRPSSMLPSLQKCSKNA